MELSTLISQHGLNVSKLETEHTLAPITNTDLFSINARISSTEAFGHDKLRVFKADLHDFGVDNGTDIDFSTKA